MGVLDKVDEQMDKGAVAPSDLTARLELDRGIPEFLFDGWAVRRVMTDEARKRTSNENVSDVLDAVVTMMRDNIKFNRA